MESSAFVPSLPRVDIAALSLFLAFALGTLLLRSGRSLVVLLVGELRARQARRSSAVPRQEALHSSALLHTGCQLLLSMTSPLFAIVGSGVLTRHRWEAEGGAAATVFLDAAAPLHAAFVFIYCLSVVLVVWGRTVFPAHTTYLLFALFHATLLMLAAPLGTAEFVFLPVNCPRAGGSRAACLDSFFWPIHVGAGGIVWVTSLLPVASFVYGLELWHGVCYLLAVLYWVHQSGELTLWFALRHAFGTALLSLVVTPFALTLLYEPPLSSVGVAELDTCPKPLRPLRAAVVRAAMGARRHAFGGQPILDASSHAFILVYATSLLCFHLAAAPFTTSFLYIGNRFCGFMVSVACALARARESTATKIVADAAALAAEADAAAVEALRSAAVAAQSEAAILRGVAAALTALLPGAVAVGVASFHASGGVDALGSLFVSASSGAAERALSSALPDAVGALPPPPSRASPSDPLPPPPLCSSVHALCSLAVAAEAAGGAAAAPRLDSADAPLGLQAFSDWAAAAACGGDALPTQRALTLRIDAGSVCVGFATVHFPTPARASRDTSASVRSALDIAGRALFVRRAFSVVEGAGARGVSSSDGGAPSAAAAAHADASPPPPPAPAAAAAPGAMPRQISGGRRAGSVGALCAGGSTQRILAASSGAPLLERAPSGNGGNGGGGAAGAAGGSASERAATAAADFSALDACAEADAVWLRSPECDAWALPDEELVRLSTSMAHSLGLLRRFRLAPATWRRFVAACAARYSDEVPFHNWRHAWTVAHCAWRFLDGDGARLATCAGLDATDLLALVLAALIHDAEHPGLTNAFQVNTASELAITYSDISVLESHHAAVGWRTIAASGLLESLNPGERKALRSVTVAAVLSTDMSKHQDMVYRMQRLIDAAASPAVSASGDRTSASAASPAHAAPSAASAAFATSPHAAAPRARAFFASTVEERTACVCFLLHAADLGCATLATKQSQRIARELRREFEAQGRRELASHFPVTVLMAADDAAAARSECGFIDFVVRPTYAVLAQLSPSVGGACQTWIEVNRTYWGNLAGDRRSMEAAQRGGAAAQP